MIRYSDWMLATPQSDRLKRLIPTRTAEWVAVRRSYAAGLTVSEIVRELALDRESVMGYLGEGWKKALRDQHAKARKTGFYNGGWSLVDMRRTKR